MKKKNSRNKSEKGITLLLVVVILSALSSVSLGIFNIIYGQIKISGEIADSATAFYSAEQGVEKTLYLDRTSYKTNPYGICGSTPGFPCYSESQTESVSGGCYDLAVNKDAGGTTDIKVLGQYRCGINPLRVVKRGFGLTY